MRLRLVLLYCTADGLLRADVKRSVLVSLRKPKSRAGCPAGPSSRRRRGPLPPTDSPRSGRECARGKMLAPLVAASERPAC